MKFIEKILLNLRNKIQIDNHNNLELGKFVKIRNCSFKVRGKNNIIKISDNVNLNGVKLEIRGEFCKIIIGEGTVIGTNSYLSARESNISITVGKNCMFSRNVKLMTSDGHPIFKNGERINEAKNIFVGDNVWLSDDVFLLKGSLISSGSVVGIKSIVTKVFSEENITIAGIPGKKVNDNISWKK